MRSGRSQDVELSISMMRAGRSQDVELGISVTRAGRPQDLLRGAKHLCDEGLEGLKTCYVELSISVMRGWKASRLATWS